MLDRILSQGPMDIAIEILLIVIMLHLANSPYFLPKRKGSTRKNARRISRKGWLVKVIDPLGDGGYRLEIEAVGTRRDCHKIIFRPGHPDIEKIADLRPLDFITFKLVEDPSGEYASEMDLGSCLRLDEVDHYIYLP